MNSLFGWLNQAQEKGQQYTLAQLKRLKLKFILAVSQLIGAALSVLFGILSTHWSCTIGFVWHLVAFCFFTHFVGPWRVCSVRMVGVHNPRIFNRGRSLTHSRDISRRCQTSFISKGVDCHFE
jgi:hypothetical protein